MTPATFIAMPCTPVGSPNLNSERITAQSGFVHVSGVKCTTSLLLKSSHSA
jgi:hypothetical protein